MQKKVRTYNLEIPIRKDFIPKEGSEKLTVRAISKSAYLSFMMFAGVGLPYAWGERLLWCEEQWDTYQSNDNIFLYLGFRADDLIGYFELNHSDESSMEIKYFGLLPEHTGKGLGSAFLTSAVEQCYKLGAQKVWLHTCELDHPKAIDNYIARGFVQTSEYIVEEFVPDKDESLALLTSFFQRYISKYRSTN